VLDGLHAVHEDTLGLENFLILVGERKVNKLLSLLECFDRRLDVRRIFVNLLKGS